MTNLRFQLQDKMKKKEKFELSNDSSSSSPNVYRYFQ